MSDDAPEARARTAAGRLSTRLRSREFAAFALELVLLVGGILLALGLDRRIQAMEEDEIATAALLTLRSDLEGTLGQIREFGAFEQARVDASARAYQALSAERVPQDSSLWLGLRVLASRRTLALPSTGYNELLATGGLRLLEPRLRHEITRYYELLIRDQNVVARNNESFTDDLYAPFFVGQGMVVLTAPEADQSIELLSKATEIRIRSGMPTDISFDGRIWSTALGDAERTQARSIVAWMNAGAAAGVLIATDMEARTQALIDEVQAALEREGFGPARTPTR
jgi:hypothetical protein